MYRRAMSEEPELEKLLEELERRMNEVKDALFSGVALIIALKELEPQLIKTLKTLEAKLGET
jgi:hypothetical protein